ncbi:DUF6468 domain-containing protein [Sphingobium boeckii]|uniref:DUF6468 domain-containing protein n=1 Tax=Sphingobium boeckii TaxID=1082345 RepID=A0A7W9AGQ1_9SPHN|nr:DUF6468 domain-containing protein [Sphingobium boeckii]MBB5685258.1 hypothetical protein [Sphingobium boeckii]
MIFATLTNLVLIILCVAVLIQSARLLYSFRMIKSGDLAETVKSLDRATAQARAVLGELKDILSVDGAANARTIASGASLREELSVMVGIGNAVAERIMDAAGAASPQRDEKAVTRKPVPRAPAHKRRARAADATNGLAVGTVQ